MRDCFRLARVQQPVSERHSPPTLVPPLVPRAHGARQAKHAIRAKASAERTIVPRFPGSCNPASTTTSDSRPGALFFRDHRRQVLVSGVVANVPRSNPAVQPAPQSAAASPLPVPRLAIRAASATRRSPGAATTPRAGAPNPGAAKTQAMCSPARRASSSRFGPSIPARPFSSRPGLASARRNSFKRAFCLLCTIRRHPCEPSRRLADSKPFCREVAQSTALLNLHRCRCCDSFRLCGVCNCLSDVCVLRILGRSSLFLSAMASVSVGFCLKLSSTPTIVEKPEGTEVDLLVRGNLARPSR